MLRIDPHEIQSFDERRDIAIPGDAPTTLHFAAEHWVKTAEEAIAKRSRFCVALSGGATPNAIYQLLSKKPFASRIDWSKVFLFWSDERAVPPDHPDSNYFNAMKNGLAHLPIPSHQIFRMQAESPHLDHQAAAYEKILHTTLDIHLFDLVMLGVGEDGHTASLFPNTAALSVQKKLVVANYLPDKKIFRMTLTFECIEKSRLAVIYAFGIAKKSIINQVLHAPAHSEYPSSRIGTKSHKCLWIIDKDAATHLIK